MCTLEMVIGLDVAELGEAAECKRKDTAATDEIEASQPGKAKYTDGNFGGQWQSHRMDPYHCFRPLIGEIELHRRRAIDGESPDTPTAILFSCSSCSMPSASRRDCCRMLRG